MKIQFFSFLAGTLVIAGCSGSVSSSVDPNQVLPQQLPIPSEVSPPTEVSANPVTPPVIGCANFSGQYQMNADLFNITQSGCTQMEWTFHNWPSPDQVIDYAIDGQERSIPQTNPAQKVLQKAYWDTSDLKKFVVESRYEPAKNGLKSRKRVYSIMKTVPSGYSPCGEMLIGDPMGPSLVVERYDNGSTSRTSCDYWSKQQ